MMGDMCVRSGEVVLVVIEDQRRTVETFYDCVDLDVDLNGDLDVDLDVDLDENLLGDETMKSHINNPPIDSRMRPFVESLGVHCEKPNTNGVSNIRYLYLPKKFTRDGKKANLTISGSCFLSWPRL